MQESRLRGRFRSSILTGRDPTWPTVPVATGTRRARTGFGAPAAPAGSGSERRVPADESRADGGRRVLGPSRPTPEAAPPDYVTIIVVMADLTLPLAEIKKRLSEIVDGVEQKHDRVVLTRNGRPAAVILSPDDLESLEETLAILSNPSAMHDIRQAESEIDQGHVVTTDLLRAKYLTK